MKYNIKLTKLQYNKQIEYLGKQIKLKLIEKI